MTKLPFHPLAAWAGLVCVFLLGAACPGSCEDVIPASAQWRFLPGRTPASTPDPAAWRQTGFDDSSWNRGSAPMFFGRPFVGTELRDMRGQYSSVYLRRTFVVADPARARELLLSVLSDDGFIAWINGREVARVNVPDGEPTTSTLALEPVPEPLEFVDHPLARPWEFLATGLNTLAIQAFNRSLADSPDFALDARLALVTDNQPPAVAELTPPAGATVDELTWVEVLFDEPVLHVQTGDLLINGRPATSVTRSAPDRYVFEFTSPPNGRVTFAWSPNQAITDDLGRGNPFGGGSWSVTLDPAAARHNLAITEFMADDDRTLYDDDCDPSDWIEIHNSGPTPVNLAGWALTDDRTDLGKWRFPEYALPADGHLIVFASQKNKTNLAARVTTQCRGRTNALVGFHTNFKLNPDGEYLALVAPDGEILSEFAPAYPPQRRDVSYGRVPGAVADFAYFARPTPRAANANSGEGFTEPVRFSRSSGTFVAAFRLALTCADTNAVIRYTLDGTFPAETNRNLLTYRDPIPISTTVQVRARATRPGFLPSAPASETYLALTNDPAQLATFRSTLPVVVITTLKTATIRDSVNTTVHFSLFEPRDGRTTLFDPPALASRGGAKTRGSSTGAQPQSNFAIEWWDEFDQDRDLAPLGMPEDSEWVLYAPNEYDAALIHNPFTMELSRQMNFAAPRTRFVEVYLNKGGPVRSNDWFGLYVLMQKPGLAKGRIDAPKAQPEDVQFPEVTGSYLFKTDRLDPGDSGFSAGGAQNAYVEPKEREMKAPQRAPQLAYLSKYFRDLDAALRPTNPNYRDPVLGFRGYLAITNWMDFHLLETLSGQVDAIRLSTYFYKRREGKLEYGPRWDYDRAWESKADDRDNNPRVWDTGGGLFGPPWWNRLLADRDAWQVWVDRWQFFRPDVLSLSNLYAVVDRFTNEISAVQPREARRWTATAPRTSYPNEIRIMKSWISNRLAWVDGQLAQPPRLPSTGGVVTAGFQLTLLPPTSVSSAGNAAIFYTLDGSDPRPVTGTNQPTSLRYSGPITITTNCRIVARTRDTGRTQRGTLASTTWSGPVAATFVVSPPPLVLTELMYHPEPPPPGSPFTEDDFEFLELRNRSSQTVNLVGYQFADGITYQFTTNSAVTNLPPNARVLVVRNRAAFLSRYPGVGPIAGEFDGGLADDGETLALVGPFGEPIFQFAYDDHWLPSTDGLGFSLVLRDESTDPASLGSADRWRESSAPGGSPGTVDPPPTPLSPVVINELLAYPASGDDDWIELHNPGSTVVDISGWWLTDDLDQPRKTRLPAGTRIEPRGYLVVPGKQLRSGPQGFGLSTDHDAAWLLSADAEGTLTGWIHGFTFGGSVPGTSFGRIVASDGSEHFVALQQSTPGASNTGPRIGPIVISQIAVARSIPRLSDTLRDEFVELLNVSDLPVRLFNLSHPDRTWQLRGDAELDLPENLTLPPGGRLILVSFDPIHSPVAAAAFQARHPLGQTTVVVGPWRGRLDESSPEVRLLAPGGVLAADGSGGYPVLVEETRPRPSAPWPALGFHPGFSLVRRHLDGVATDPAQWQAAPATPGASDTDGDGLPDDWEDAARLQKTVAFGIDGAHGDPDTDGFDNLQEFRNGTHPKDAGSAVGFRFFVESDKRIVLLLEAPPGRGFNLESRNRLPPEDRWQIVRSETTPADGTLVLSIDPPPSGLRFYRLTAP